MQLCFQIIGMTTALAFLLIAIPLGYDGETNDWLFVLSQIIYCWLAFNLTRYMFEFSTPGLSLSLHYGIFCCATMSVILFYVLYFNQIREEGNLGTGILRILPSTTYVAYVIVGYFIHALQADYPPISDAALMTVSPYRTRVIIEQTEQSRAPLRQQKQTKLSTSELSDSVSTLSRPLFHTTWQEFLGIYPQLTELRDVSVQGSVVKQWAKSVIMLLAVTVVYIYCQTLALQFSNAKDSLGELGIYIFFTLSFLFIKPVIRKLGNIADENKTGGPSLELLMEMSVYFFYYTFERNLFISVHSYSSFFLIKSIYVVFELLNNTITFHKTYHQTLIKLFTQYKHSPVLLQGLKLVAGGEYADLSLQVQCLRMGMKLYFVLTTAVTFLLFFIFLRFGYNHQYYCLYNEMTNDDFSLLMNITAISVIIEILLFLFADYLYFYHFQHRGILSTWEYLLRGQFLDIPNTTVVLYLIWLMTHVTTDLYISRIDVADIGGIDCPDVE